MVVVLAAGGEVAGAVAGGGPWPSCARTAPPAATSSVTRQRAASARPNRAVIAAATFSRNSGGHRAQPGPGVKVGPRSHTEQEHAGRRRGARALPMLYRRPALLCPARWRQSGRNRTTCECWYRSCFPVRKRKAAPRLRV